jgi:hypothetical protein
VPAGEFGRMLELGQGGSLSHACPRRIRGWQSRSGRHTRSSGSRSC